jgi:DNA invertase Pin-like site-specific DNA recombinase
MVSNLERKRAAIWVRVSTVDQHSENQERDLLRMAEQRGFEVVRTFRSDGASAYKGEHRGELEKAISAAQRGEFNVLLTWSLDRLDRESAVGPFNILKRFRAAGCDVISHTESWVDTADPMFGELMVLMIGWFANFESRRRSERIRAGLARRKAQGGHVGRKTGAKDKGKRRRSGYYKRWEASTA